MDTFADSENHFREKLGDIHRDTFRSELELERTIKSQGRYVEAEDMIRETWARSKKALGDGNILVFRAMNYLAQTLESQGRLQDARDLYQAACEQAEKFLGASHVDTLSYAASLRDIEERMQRKGYIQSSE